MKRRNRRSAVELLEETKSLYVKSESVLDAKQVPKNADNLQVRQRYTIFFVYYMNIFPHRVRSWITYAIWSNYITPCTAIFIHVPVARKPQEDAGRMRLTSHVTGGQDFIVVCVDMFVVVWNHLGGNGRSEGLLVQRRAPGRLGYWSEELGVIELRKMGFDVDHGHTIASGTECHCFSLSWSGQHWRRDLPQYIVSHVTLITVFVDKNLGKP